MLSVIIKEKRKKVIWAIKKYKMGQFDIHKWKQKQLLESYNNRLSNQILDQLFEGLISQNTLLNESKFLKGLKDKIKILKLLLLL